MFNSLPRFVIALLLSCSGVLAFAQNNEAVKPESLNASAASQTEVVESGAANNPELRKQRKAIISRIYLVRHLKTKSHAVKALEKVIAAWQEQPTLEFEQACRMLFEFTYGTKKYKKYQDSLQLCPAKLRQIWSGESDRDYYIIRDLTPSIPSKAEREKISGEVVAIYDIGIDGKAKNIRIKESSDKMFNRNTKMAIAEMRFLPAIVDGVVVESLNVLRKVSYKL